MIKRWFSRGPVPRVRVLMVCMGNVCRSPTAEGVLRALLAREGLGAAVAVASAGTHGLHRGLPPDPRAVALATQRGYALGRIRSRPLKADDFDRHDMVLAMDRVNLEALHQRCPVPLRERLGLLLAHAPALATDEVPDPYYGGPPAFEHALNLIEAGCEGLLPVLQARLTTSA